MLTAPAGTPQDLVALYQIPKVCQHEGQLLGVVFTLLLCEDEWGMARARKPLEELVWRVPLLLPDSSICQMVQYRSRTPLRVLEMQAKLRGDFE